MKLVEEASDTVEFIDNLVWRGCFGVGTVIGSEVGSVIDNNFVTLAIFLGRNVGEGFVYGETSISKELDFVTFSWDDWFWEVLRDIVGEGSIYGETSISKELDFVIFSWEDWFWEVLRDIVGEGSIYGKAIDGTFSFDCCRLRVLWDIVGDEPKYGKEAVLSVFKWILFWDTVDVGSKYGTAQLLREKGFSLKTCVGSV